MAGSARAADPWKLRGGTSGPGACRCTPGACWANASFWKQDGSSAPHPELAQLQVTCTTSGKGQLMLGDASGCVTLCDRKGALKKFQAFERRVTQLCLIAQQNLLVSVGDDASASCMLKVR